MSNAMRRIWYKTVNLSRKNRLNIHFDDVYCKIDSKDHFSIMKPHQIQFLLRASISKNSYNNLIFFFRLIYFLNML